MGCLVQGGILRKRLARGNQEKGEKLPDPGQLRVVRKAAVRNNDCVE
jgi:hypothetical protein